MHSKRPRSIRNLRIASLLIPLSLLVPILACKTDGKPAAPTPEAPAGEEAVSVQGWNEAKIESASWSNRTLTIDLMGHFHFTLDACLRDAWGVYDLRLWNRIARAINFSIQNLTPVPLPSASPTPVVTPVTGNPNPRPRPTGTAEVTPPSPSPSPSPEAVVQRCFDRESRETFSFDGKLEVTSDTHKWTILETKGDQVCTAMNDLDRAMELYQALNEAIQFSAYDDCPENRPR